MFIFSDYCVIDNSLIRRWRQLNCSFVPWFYFAQYWFRLGLDIFVSYGKSLRADLEVSCTECFTSLFINIRYNSNDEVRVYVVHIDNVKSLIASTAHRN